MLGLGACANTEFQVPQAALDEHAYATLYPFFAEYCAVSEIRKKKGAGVDIEGGGPGGHSVFYLNGVCRQHDAGYPEIALCDEASGAMAGRGVGLSVNAHFRNANWVATEGREFFYAGGLTAGEGVNRASYVRTQAMARKMGILEGVVFHPEVFDDKPAGMSEHDYMYEVSISTDYAIGFGRDRYCARIPLDRDRMQAAVHYLNALNQPYRSGQKDFNWNVLRNNCAHLAHNALAAAGLWSEWPTDRPLVVAVFDFPVPKNEFVNLMRYTNDMPIADADALYANKIARTALLAQERLPTQPGALAQARPGVQPNELYETKLRLIFFDEAFFGNYQQRFDRIFSEPRYTDLATNLAYFSALYTTILTRGQPSGTIEGRADFYRHYDNAIARAKAKVDQSVIRLNGRAG